MMALVKTVWGRGEAPGRLDFLGGVADYSGSLVLEMPIAGTTKVEVRALAEDEIRLASEGEGEFCMEGGLLRVALEDPKLDWRDLKPMLLDAPAWARYPLGCLMVLARLKSWHFQGGLSFTIHSTVPQSMGVSSSAALEISTLRALAAYAGIRFEGTELARLGQIAENHLVGAPCGLMDQLTSAYGRHGHLLPIVCQPDQLGQPIPLPPGIAIVGWPSHVKHAVSASPYATARAATFMGRRLFELAIGRTLAHAADLTPSEFYRQARQIPEVITGVEFLKLAGRVDDPLSTVLPEATYCVRDALRFPVEENFRCRLACELLRGYDEKHAETTLIALGELLFQSHAGYRSLGLDCPETDSMVDAIRSLGSESGLYGARVSGGGSGGTVVVLLRESAIPKLGELNQKIVSQFAEPMPLIR